MHFLRFYPLGNADCTRIDLADGKQMLIDFGNQATGKDDDKRIDLEAELRKDLDRDGLDRYAVVVFTHLDKDHYQGASTFFWFEHSSSHQGDGRIRIDELWVPAGAITEESLESDEAILIQKEARYRLKRGEGIRVFSRPKRLEAWLASQGLTIDSRRDCITNAGETVPDFSLDGPEGVEFFIHAPYAWRANEEQIEDRNGHCLVFQARFVVNGQRTNVMFSADVDAKNWEEIVDATIAHQNHLPPHQRLDWDIFKLPHHCSALALRLKAEEGESTDKATPISQVRTLCEDYGSDRGLIISSSNPIPKKGSIEDEDKQPPRRIAANYYREDVLDNDAERFLVTMETPSVSAPKPIVIEIGSTGAVYRRHIVSSAAIVTGKDSPRAG